MLRKKLWYVPGLYSLLGLPILLLLMGPEDVKEKVVLRFFLADDRVPKNETIRFTEKGVLEYASTKKITAFELDDDHSSDYSINAKLDFIANEIRRLVYTRDTTVALKIELWRGATYGQFVWLVNQMAINNIKRYALAGNSFYIFRNPVFEEPEPVYLSLEPTVYPLPQYERPSRWQRFKWELEYQLQVWEYYISKNYVLTSGFVLFILLPFIFRIRKFGKLLPSRQHPLQS